MINYKRVNSRFAYSYANQ